MGDGGPGCATVAPSSTSPIHVLVANTQHALLAVLTYNVSVTPATGN